MTINEKEDQLIEEMQMFEDWTDKYDFIINLGKELEPMAESDKNENNLVNGCTSKVWIKESYNGNVINFKADSDALIPKGIASLILRIYSDNKPSEILNFNPKFLKELDLINNLSPNRANGLKSMIDRIRKIVSIYIDPKIKVG